MIWELRHEHKIGLLIEIADIPRSTYYYYSKQFDHPKPDRYAEIKTEIEDKIKALKEVKEKDDKAAIETAYEALTTSLQKIGEIMQKAAEAASKSSEPTADKKEGETVHEGEVVDDSDKNK